MSRHAFSSLSKADQFRAMRQLPTRSHAQSNHGHFQAVLIPIRFNIGLEKSLR
jgi:hypothetical protein